METITKFEAAKRQLTVAIQMYFEDGDSVAIHTLACAAREIFEKHCAINKVHRYFDNIKIDFPELEDGEIWAAMNNARNFFKHPDRLGNFESSIELHDEDNKAVILIAAYDCSSIMFKETPEIFINYVTWATATNPRYRTEPYRSFFPELEARFPGLHLIPPEIQKQIGKILVLKKGIEVEGNRPS